MTYESPYFGWIVPYEWQEPDYEEPLKFNYDDDDSDFDDYLPIMCKI